MSDFLTAIDIANRGLGHLGLGGSKRITAFTDDTKAASEMGFVYDKLRKAELRRNVWVFSIRKAVLRPLDTNSRRVTFPAWASGTTYSMGAVVKSGNLIYYSLVDSNLGNTPGSDFTNWAQYFGPVVASFFDTTTSPPVAYFSGELVYDGSDVVYLSLIDNNVDTPPSSNWRTLTGATVAAISFLYPVGSGPATQSSSRNVYMLPNGYLREAPQDPKAGATSFLGAPTGRMYDDWVFENGVFTTRVAEPIIFRFAADVANVPQMDTMFCEGLAARLALETCETLTQSTEKLQVAAQAYTKFMGEARTVNGIEEGPTEPPEDDWITCRI